MSYTIRQFVESALEEIGMAAYVFDAAPDQLLSAAKRLNSMLAEWNARGIRLGATLYSNPADIDLDADSNVPDNANEAIITNLALRIAPMYGKSPMPATALNAKRAYDVMLLRFAQPVEMQLGEIPSGAGNKPWRWFDPYTPEAEPTLTDGTDSPLEFF
jgi:hypothetical protein